MIKLIVLGLIILLAGCKEPENLPRQLTSLVDKYGDTLGIVSCVMPEEFDTTYKWVHTSDCTCCDAVKYRSHSRKYKAITEDGFLHDSHLDSGFYFTISHYTHIACDTSKEHFYKDSEATSAAYNKRFEQNIRELEELGGTKVIFDTGRVINKNLYNIFYFTEKDYYKVQENDSAILKNITFNTVSATTTYKDRRVSFTAKSNVHNRDSFYLLAMNMMKTIKIQ